MANDVNQCNFIGRLGADPEARYTPTGKQTTRFRLACGWKTKEKEGTEWIPVTTWGRLAEICEQYLRKGSRVYVSGRFTTRKWTDNTGADRYMTEIIAEHLQMLDPKPAASPGQSTPRSAPSGPPPVGTPDMPDDDIPF